MQSYEIYKVNDEFFELQANGTKKALSFKNGWREHEMSRIPLESTDAKKILAKFPSVAAIVAEDESCHRFIGRPRLQLIVRTLALSASPTLKREQMEMGA